MEGESVERRGDSRGRKGSAVAGQRRLEKAGWVGISSSTAEDEEGKPETIEEHARGSGDDNDVDGSAYANSFRCNEPATSFDKEGVGEVRWGRLRRRG
ncbi:unnamed protein product [Linum trigynum]|uniref:Uncharacterized protein n=1 Tax=Linum trigynum TaxID=586398 RepID=A0AAV2FQ42_9ROSI